jgi:DNA-binding MarR family transcriptional regulator
MQMMEREQLTQVAFCLLGRLLAWADPGRVEEWAELGLTITQIRTLFLLQRLDGPTRIVDRLERQGLVRREMDREDRRQVRHLLTPEGEGVVARLESLGRAQLEQALALLTEEELEALVRGLLALCRAVGVETEGEVHPS